MAFLLELLLLVLLIRLIWKLLLGGRRTTTPNHSQQPKQQEGQVRVHQTKAPTENKYIDKGKGEYIDFEELK